MPCLEDSGGLLCCRAAALAPRLPRGYALGVIAYEDMTADERDRFVSLILGEKGITAVTLIMRRRHGPAVTTEQVMRFAFKVAMRRALGKRPAGGEPSKPL